MWVRILSRLAYPSVASQRSLSSRLARSRVSTILPCLSACSSKSLPRDKPLLVSPRMRREKPPRSVTDARPRAAPLPSRKKHQRRHSPLARRKKRPNPLRKNPRKKRKPASRRARNPARRSSASTSFARNNERTASRPRRRSRRERRYRQKRPASLENSRRPQTISETHHGKARHHGPAHL